MRQRLLSLADFFGTAGTEEPELGGGFYSAPVPIGSYSRRCSRRNAGHLAPGEIRAGIKEYECPLRRKFNPAGG